MNEKRIQKVLDTMKKLHFNQILISDPVSIYYLTGYREETGERFYGLYMNTAGRRIVFLHHMFPGPKGKDLEVRRFSDTEDVADFVSPVLDRTSPLGVDKDLHARFLLPLVKKQGAGNVIIGSPAVDQVRGIKEQEEITLMEEVSRINDKAVELLRYEVKPGITESELAEKLLPIYRNLGAEGFSFDPLIAFGPNAAEPHHSPDDTVLKPGDCLLFDIGCKMNGYCADMTRTFFYQDAGQKEKNLYRSVLQANEEAIKAVKPGLPINELDRMARRIISHAGYGEFFNHRLGHFIGMDVHEFGDISETNTDILQEGMIFSIEPGIYLKGETGVRIEDLVVVTSDGCRRLNLYPKELEILN